VETVNVDLHRLAEERGYAIAEVDVDLGQGKVRPVWLMYDFGSWEFVAEAVNWTAEEVMDYIRESSGPRLHAVPSLEHNNPDAT
jgi:hypothetical protein